MRHKVRFTEQKITARLAEVEAHVFRRRNILSPFRFKELEGPQHDQLRALKLDAEGWKIIHEHDYWAKPQTNFVLTSSFQVPDTWPAHQDCALHLPIGVSGDFSHPEALVYIDGEPIAACDRHHQEIFLPDVYRDGKEHQLLLHGWTGLGGSTVGDPNKRLKMNPCSVVQIDQTVRDFVSLSRAALGILVHLNDNQEEGHKLLTALDEAYKLLDLRLPIGGDFFSSVPQALECLQNGIEHSGSPLDAEITAVGHAHIDTAWLWTIAQTRQKAGRSFHTVKHLMQQFPEYQFTQSQPQLYDYLNEDYPELFAEIKSLIEEGRWEPIGGMWVEADCNISGPESLARQFLLGRSYFREQFGHDAESPVLWLPDVFGYAWNLPQLIKEAGMEYFFTIKMGWNQYNRIPYDSFWWQGLDGTKVLTHFSTTKNPESAHASTYNSDASPGQILGTWLNFQQKDYTSPQESVPLLMSYGWGDGGGGPTREMLENIRTLASFPAAPKVKAGKVIDFYKQLDSEEGTKLPTWNGELYFEYHRGTYTTQARNKRANRKSEFLLHDAEFLTSFAALLDPTAEYPADQFNVLWKLVCLNQFHDIIPGSSIKEVYEDSLEQYALVDREGKQIVRNALETIESHVSGDWLLINPTSFTQNSMIKLETSDEMAEVRLDGQFCAVQAVEGGWLVSVNDLKPFSVSSLVIEAGSIASSAADSLTISENHLENELLRIELNADGDICRIFDKEYERELMPEDTLANQWQAFEDRPLSYDAWDIEIYYDDKQWLANPAVSIAIVEEGPLRVRLKIKRKILNSDFVQTISLSKGSKRIDFDTWIDWRERKVLLKTAFPVNVLAPKATYEIQWGSVERPTHKNTSWDWARFETAAQKWVDLSEGGYGASLLNDCKYGHDIHDNVMRLTLLKSSTAPDPEADLGEHQFKYSLLPHGEYWQEDTIREAYLLNDPIIIHQPAGANGSRSQLQMLTADQPNIVIETIKNTEDGKGLIVRLYETQRKRGKVNISCGFNIAEAWRTNILEESQEELAVHQNQIELLYKPFQIITLRILPNNDKGGRF